MGSHDNREQAYYTNERGACYFQARHYVEAEKDYRKAIDLAGDEDPNSFIFRFNLANVLLLMWRFDEAAPMYEHILESDAPLPLRNSVRLELRNLSYARQRRGINANDQRLYRIAAQLIPMYPRMSRPVCLAWVDESSESMAWITRIQDECDTPKNNRVISFSGWEAIGHVIGGQHWIFIKTNRWSGASDLALSGLLSHELVHEELKDAWEEAFMEGNAAEGHVHDERSVDQIAIDKGFGQELMASRRIMESGESEHRLGLMSSKEIWGILNSTQKIAMKAEFQSGVADSLAQKLGGDDRLVQEEYRKAIPLWQSVAKTEKAPSYAKQKLEEAIIRSGGELGRTKK